MKPTPGPRAAARRLGAGGWLLAALLCVLSGCATRQPSTAGSEQVLPVALSGRLAVRVEPDAPNAKPRSSSGSFELLGEPSRGELRLASPLGSLLAVASWQPGEAWLRADGQTRRFADLDELTREMVGEALPVAALFDWLRGRPWSEAPSEPLPDGAPGFVQLGWQVRLAQAADRLITAVRLTLPAVTVRAKLDPS
ncbi:outer membrane lipoprotein LolB [Aquabacterium sp. A7-Y]|uniref:outer membrane lipoprotein LolB n=1 Tax=Aquabacterium sp. A7-Y TaxID=1349605 RepID=UPI00223C9851|nr:outer membrane lipoprotein LolB [Aquabacterium sp. A7-Y]MCW7537484.1 outer membrane lipoprotein LolB [Aquabacterium sp. A7-Y]